MKYVTQQFIHHIKEVAEASSNKTMNTLKEQTKGMNSTNAILWYIMNREKVLERYEKTIFDGLNFDIRDISEFVFQDTLEDKIYIVFSLNFMLNKIDAEIERLEASQTEVQWGNKTKQHESKIQPASRRR